MKTKKITNEDDFYLYKVVVSPFFTCTFGHLGHHFKYSILIKPTNKTFYEYSFKDILHIGVVDERDGIVYSFWYNGINKECASIEWMGSVKTFGLVETKKSKDMDSFLKCCKSFFIEDKYNCNTWNCFDFVLAFLNFYGYPIRYLSKEIFTKKVISPVLLDTLRYCRLVKSLEL